MWHTRFMLDKQGYARARTHTHMKYLLLSTVTMIRERASVLRYILVGLIRQRRIWCPLLFCFGRHSSFVDAVL